MQEAKIDTSEKEIGLIEKSSYGDDSWIGSTHESEFVHRIMGFPSQTSSWNSHCLI
jgi:hypothetical protein